jgi:hypothetical protein
MPKQDSDLSRREFIASGVASFGLVNLLLNSGQSKNQKNVAELPNYLLRTSDWAPQDITKVVCEEYGFENVFNTRKDCYELIHSKDNSWEIAPYFPKDSGERGMLEEKLPGIGKLALVDRKNKKVYSLATEDDLIGDSFSDSNICGLGDNGLAVYSCLDIPEGNWEYDVKAIVFADIEKRKKTILSPQKSRWETGFITGDDFNRGFILSGNGKRGVIYSDPKNPKVHFIDTENFNIVHEQKNSLLVGINYYGNIIVTEERDGNHRLNLDTKEKTFLYKGNDLFLLNPDGNFVLGTENQLSGISNNKREILDTGGLRIYNHTRKRFFQINNPNISYYDASINDDGTVILRDNSNNGLIELRYSDGRYKTYFHNLSEEEINNFGKIKIEETDKVVFSPVK